MGRLHVAVDGADPVVVMSGEFDLSTAEEVQACLTTVGRRVVLDMTETTFLDSTTLNILLAARNAGTTITIANPPSAVRRVLEVTRFDNLFEIHDSQPDPTLD